VLTNLAKYPSPLSDQELIAYSKEHLRYELEMFFLVADAITRTGYFSDFVRNALVESFTIHLRNLIDFFFEPAAVKRTDILAAYFLVDPNYLGTVSKALSEARERANKEVGHLTTGRRPHASPKKTWQVGALAREIFQLTQKFASGADPQKLDTSIIQLIAGLGRATP
jgi:hypothetical protein